MLRKRALKRSRIVSIVVASGVGYVVGNWHPATLSSTDLSAAQTVSLRFPLDWQDATVVKAAFDAAVGPADAAVVGDSQLALLSPQPMVSQSPVAPTADVQAAAPQTEIQVAAVETDARAGAPDVALPRRPMLAAAPIAAAKPAPVPIRHHADRPGFMLNDSQIASIKQRLHLTADQERMWPAVEAALRNIAYARAREAQRRGAPAPQLASADANSVEVQGLKSAAIPLLMSFNDEQKDEVRNLAHVMGLDQLASQF